MGGKAFRVAYFTVRAPFGRGEAFVLNEMVELLGRRDVDLLIVPLRPDTSKCPSGTSQELEDKVLVLPLVDWTILKGFLRHVMRDPFEVLKLIVKVLYHSRPAILLKNLVLVPKGVWVAQQLQEMGVDHIHAHWASTPSTCAYMAAQLSAIPWSFTAHSWDIPENNMLKEKVRTATFVRSISEGGKEEIGQIVGKELQNRVCVIHMGVKMQNRLKVTHAPDCSIIVCVANFVDVKGHKYLLEACDILRSRSIKFKCVLVGDGPTREAMQAKATNLNLNELVQFRGFLPHEQIEALLQQRPDIAVLPSIVTDKRQKEGIPVTLMEAMAYGIPVVSTDTGGIPELLSDGAGLMVRHKDPAQLADAVERLLKDSQLARVIGDGGHQKVYEEFNLTSNVQRLLQMMKRAKNH